MKFKKWVQYIEKYADLANLGYDGRIKRVAYQVSRGTISKFIHIYTKPTVNTLLRKN